MRGTSGSPVWQRNYHEHIIRDETELEEIRRYILENPLRWDDDPENLDAGAVREPPLRRSTQSGASEPSSSLPAS